MYCYMQSCIITKTFMPWHQMVFLASSALTSHHLRPSLWHSVYTRICLSQYVSPSWYTNVFLIHVGNAYVSCRTQLTVTFFQMPLKTVALNINLWVFLLSNITLYFIASSSLNCELVEGIYCRQIQYEKAVKGLVSRLQ